MNNKVFVYGTLKKGGSNNTFLTNSKYLGASETKDNFRLITDGVLPYVDKKESNNIKGEVYEVDDWTFMMLDNLEGHPHYYNREQVIIKDHGLCWLYFINDTPLHSLIEIKSGDWDNNYRRKKSFISQCDDFTENYQALLKKIL